MKSKKPNRNSPVRVEEKELRIKEAERLALDEQWAILFTILCDKYGFRQKRAKAVWEEIDKLSHESATSAEFTLGTIRAVGKLTGDPVIANFSPVRQDEKKIVTQGDLDRECRRAQNNIRVIADAVILKAMRNLYGWGGERLSVLLRYIREYTQEIKEKRITVKDLETVLKEEVKIVL